MPFAQHYAEHITHLQSIYSDAMSETGHEFDAVLLHSGSERYYYADDQATSFRAFPYFSHWLPVNRPGQLLLIMPGKSPIYFQVVARDFWHEQTIVMESWVANQFSIYTLESSSEVVDRLTHLLKAAGSEISRLAFLGENTSEAIAMGLGENSLNPTKLLSWLDYQRAYKTAYEVASIRQANRLALQGHRAARRAFESGASEYDIHMAYLSACNILEQETPYTNIVAIDEKSAILHYQNKRRDSAKESQVLLIDAGCRINGYCSDVTRTFTRPHALALFQDIVAAMEALQAHLIGRITPGQPYSDIHIAAQQGISTILLQHGICRGSEEDLRAHKISTLFMPHGVGHLLGLQVHDVGGRQINVAGDIKPPPAEYPSLRTTRIIEKRQVFTIEPGLYFIPQLLDPERVTERGKLINWKLVDALIPLGGIRIEDNVLVTQNGVENLTRVLI